MKKRVVSLLMICALSVGMLAGCGSSETQNQATGSADNTQPAGTETVAETKTPEAADDANLTATQQIIKQAEGMTMEELAQKAIEESNGKTFYGVGNSSRGKAALPLFIEYLQSIDPSYSMEFDCTGDKVYDNCWDFVGEGVHALFMDIDSEVVGKNFLYMLTEDKYAAMLKDAFNALPADEQAYFQPTIDEMESEASDLGLGADGKYALAWIKLWVGSYNAQTDDGPICNTLVTDSATDQCGLLVYNKFRSVEESAGVSVNNVKVAAYQDGYQGIGGYGYCHYLFVTDNSPLPWTACAFIAYMTCTEDGYSAWGKDMGSYSYNPEVAKAIEATYQHSTGGMDANGNVEFENKNDRGFDWWSTDGKLVMEDPEYCASVSFTVGSWIELLPKYTAE